MTSLKDVYVHCISLGVERVISDDSLAKQILSPQLAPPVPGLVSMVAAWNVGLIGGSMGESWF